MTLSSASRQHRKSMLPTPRLSSRISSRRAASGDTSRIARRVPSPLLATPHNNNGSTAAQARVPPPPAANCNLSLPKLSTRHAGSRSRTPGLVSGRTSCPTPEQSDASSSLMSTPCPEVKKADAQFYAPHPSAAGPKDEQRLKAQEGRTVPTQHQQPETRNPTTAASTRLQHPTARRPVSTAFAAGFSRIENTSSGDGAGAGARPSAARKKSSFTASVSGKENRQPQLRTRVPAPPITPPVAVVPSVPPRSIRRTVAVVAQPSRASSRESAPPRPLVVRKRTLHAPAAGSPLGDSSRIRSAAAAGAPLGFPAGIKALVEDIDCFAKGWTEMFDGLSAGAHGPEGRPSKLDSFARIHPTVQPENAGTCQADGPATEKRKHKFLFPGSAGSVSTLQASPLVSTDGETVHVDLKPVNLARWQHRENATVKGASVDDKSVSDHSSPFPTAVRDSSLS